ncbi:hypothetical protein K7X08_025366 [Anisodus acutangulus]|uniref:Programmed cell death protein 2 C-terminal domain-containing protein n=1 Tax=Anisodus acutangulus TaxID=402998 RepID=A0A9Q1LTX7_9SOLA|nr:hypothetical protein K7X08_025366 [Anisodus acutangulus]
MLLRKRGREEEEEEPKRPQATSARISLARAYELTISGEPRIDSRGQKVIAYHCPFLLETLCSTPQLSKTKYRLMGGVFLGMPGPWAGHMHEAADHYTTKIGGLPDWPIPLLSTSVDLLKCSVCKSDLCLLAQVYAPISKKNLNIEERIIYVFVCLMPEYGSATVSWRAIRIQKSVNSEGLKSQSDTAVSSPASSISDSKKEWKKDIWSFDSLEEDDDEDDDDIDLAELGRALSEAASMASHSKKQNHGHDLTSKTSSTVCAAIIIDKTLPVILCFYIYAAEEKFSTKDASVCSKSILSPIKDHENDPDTREETWENNVLDTHIVESRFWLLEMLEAVSDKEKHALDNWNWMTLIVYTCSQNCSKDKSSDDGWIVAEEAVVVQYE